ncbi:MAG: rRNA maturation RNase YbeY [Vulcanimicrobiaceae bacterium]
MLEAVQEGHAAISLSLVGDDEMRELNRLHRGKNRATDVLSFPLQPDQSSPERLLGDIVISVETAARQAAGYDATVRAEIDRLLIHGVLHLVGHDHEERVERARMEAEERRLAESIGLAWPYEGP